MNDEPTPRKSDAYDSSREQIQRSNRRSNQGPSVDSFIGKTFDLRKSFEPVYPSDSHEKREEHKEPKQLTVIEEDMDIS